MKNISYMSYFTINEDWNNDEKAVDKLPSHNHILLLGNTCPPFRAPLCRLVSEWCVSVRRCSPTLFFTVISPRAGTFHFNIVRLCSDCIVEENPREQRNGDTRLMWRNGLMKSKGNMIVVVFHSSHIFSFIYCMYGVYVMYYIFMFFEWVMLYNYVYCIGVMEALTRGVS